MSPASFVITRHRDRAAAVTRLAVAGQVDEEASRHLLRRLHGEFGRSRGGTVVVDLGDVAGIGAAGVRVLLQAYTRALRGGHGFAVENAGDHLWAVLGPAGLVGDAGPSAYDRVWLDEVGICPWPSAAAG